MPWGLRQYTVDDLAGHRWEFAQHMRDVPAAEWGAIMKEQALAAMRAVSLDSRRDD
jgi:hypothetical protein